VLNVELLYITIILPVVLCGCETWSSARREGRRLRELEKRGIKRKLGRTGSNKRLDKVEEIHNFEAIVS
jgi:hypothetical protein